MHASAAVDINYVAELHTKVQYSAPRLNGHRLSSNFLAVKAGWPIIRAILMQIGHLVFEKTGQLSGMAV